MTLRFSGDSSRLRPRQGGAARAGGGRSSPRAFDLHAHDPKILPYRGANGEREGGENRVGTVAIGRVGKRGERERERGRETLHVGILAYRSVGVAPILFFNSSM